MGPRGARSRGVRRGGRRPAGPAAAAEPEPGSLTRFLVEAESTGTSFILICSKVELVDEQTRIEFLGSGLIGSF
ncbi:unnamed protein product [Urochloa humidicola]